MSSGRVSIRVVTPILAQGFRTAADVATSSTNGVDVSLAQIERGPESIESEFDDALAVPDTLRLVREAAEAGVDAVVIDCMADPGLEATRELVSIPVFGPCQTSMQVAAMLGHRYSVVTVLDAVVPGFWNRARVYGTAQNMASVRSIDIPVLELDKDPERLVRALVDESAAAVREDGADVLIFGCTGMLGCAARVQAGLEAAGIGGVPVIDPVPVTIDVAAAIVRSGLTVSQRAYPAPRAKSIVGYAFGNAATGAREGG